MDFKGLYEKAVDVMMAFDKKFEKINNMLFEKFQIKINVGVYVLAVVLFLFIALMVKTILGMCLGFLTGSN